MSLLSCCWNQCHRWWLLGISSNNSMTILNPPQITTQLTGADFCHSLKDTKPWFNVHWRQYRKSTTTRESTPYAWIGFCISVFFGHTQCLASFFWRVTSIKVFAEASASGGPQRHLLPGLLGEYERGLELRSHSCSPCLGYQTKFSQVSQGDVLAI